MREHGFGVLPTKVSREAATAISIEQYRFGIKTPANSRFAPQNHRYFRGAKGDNLLRPLRIVTTLVALVWVWASRSGAVAAAAAERCCYCCWDDSSQPASEEAYTLLSIPNR